MNSEPLEILERLHARRRHAMHASKFAEVKMDNQELTEADAQEARQILKTTKDWQELAEAFPKFADAVDALPDMSKLCSVNSILRDIVRDAIKRAKR